MCVHVRRIFDICVGVNEFGLEKLWKLRLYDFLYLYKCNLIYIHKHTCSYVIVYIIGTCGNSFDRTKSQFAVPQTSEFEQRVPVCKIVFSLVLFTFFIDCNS